MLDTCSIYRVARLDCPSEVLSHVRGPQSRPAMRPPCYLPIGASMQQHVPYELTCSRQQHARSTADHPSLCAHSEARRVNRRVTRTVCLHDPLKPPRCALIGPNDVHDRTRGSYRGATVASAVADDCTLTPCTLTSLPVLLCAFGAIRRYCLSLSPLRFCSWVSSP
jgi:hypothetical protein